MSTRKHRVLKAGAILVAITLVGGYAAATGYADNCHPASSAAPQQTMPTQQARASQQATAARPVDNVSLQIIHSKQVPAVQEALDRAVQHLEAGRRQEALDELKQVRTSLESLRLALGKHIGPQIVNDRCPIMGGKIDPETVSPRLTRIHGKDRVAFCCEGCPAEWSHLTFAERTAKLEAVTVVQDRPSQDTQGQQ